LIDNPSLKKFLYYWLPVWIFCIAIFIQSSFPSPEQLPSFDYSDKLLHVGAYAVLSILFFRAFRAGKPDSRTISTIMLCVVFTTLYGVSDEVHQHFVPSRSADIMDVMADFIGSVAGALFMAYFFRRRLRVSQPVR